MKKGWEVKKLGDMCEFCNGLWSGKKPPYIEVGVIRNTNFTKDCEFDDSNIAYLNVEQSQFAKRKLQYGDIILEKSGGGPKQAVGRVIVFDKKEGDFSFSNFTSVIRAKNKKQIDFSYLHRYLFWAYISGVTENMQSHSTGIRNLKFVEYKQIPILLPPLPEQKHIVKILDEAFEAIDKAKANIEKNYLKSDELHQSLLNKILNEDEDKWKKSTLVESCEFWNGKAHEKHIDEQGNYIVVNSKFISSEGVVKKYTSEQMFPLYKGDIAMVMSDVPNGKALAKCYLIEEDNLYSLNQRICTIRSENFVKKYLFYQLNRHKYLLSFNNGENQTNLRKGEILKTPLTIPPFEKQQVIVEELDQLVAYSLSLAANYQKKLKNLEELKKSILQKAFNGELAGACS